MYSEKQLEHAEALDEAVKQSGIASIAQQITGGGSDTCIECNCNIPQARRNAAPWAVRCRACQANFEKHSGV